MLREEDGAPVSFPSLREFAARCRSMALTARHPVAQQRLIKMAAEMERQAALFEREDATSLSRSRKAG